MMENYEDMDIRLGHGHRHINAKELVNVREVTMQQQSTDATEFINFEGSQTDFGFGAEILSTNSVVVAAAAAEATSESQTKANSEIKTKPMPKIKEQEIAAKKKQQKQQLEKSNKSNSEADDDEDFKSSSTNSENGDGESFDASSSTDGSSVSLLDCISVGLTDWKISWLQQDGDPNQIWYQLSNLLTEPRRRIKLETVNTFDDVITLVRKSQRIIVLTGAGVSVSCGIPDFRSTNGIYARLAHDYPDLPDPQAMFDINYFKRDPRPFFKFAREIYPGEFSPSPCHRFIKMLEIKGKLLRNYTQNIDTLERVAGIKRVIECHGSFSTASCTRCRYKCNAEALRADIFAQRIPVCPRCQPNVEHSVDASVAVNAEQLRLLVARGIMKPDIVFFGQGLPDEYHNVMATDKDRCDLLIVIGSSLKVRPVAHIPSSIPPNVPQILINREQLPHLKFDVELLGDSDVIISQICHRMAADRVNWQEIAGDEEVLCESNVLLPPFGQYPSPSQADTDTQSVRSTGSAAGTCSDSGFESSTFTAVQPKRPITVNAVDQAAIERIKSDILTGLEDPPVFASTSAQAAAIRSLSIDSGKDSGLDPFDLLRASNIEIGPSPPAYAANTQAQMKIPAPLMSPPPPRRRQTIAERLQPGTFYCHRNSSSYVFPGAQVFWDTDFSDDESDDDTCPGDLFSSVVDSDDEECDLNEVPLSPLLTPGLEAHIVTDLTSDLFAAAAADNISPNKRRHSSLQLPAPNAEEAWAALQAARAHAVTPPPPIKKRRSSVEDSSV
ncbi:NAD-dependent histone deacetylase sirtuin-1 isoform X2 [Drosophila busckii]|uniref:NAD-dependent histone deacetylase sirtuin-1 isoform X2 n=1 Tax=Drosophila busckii TaxID=30019 RepID=UPI00083F0606|nr:NAD-dependent histone deacetylase sirtuin-1 isoform X2 [Drosophila busckii]